MLLCHISFRLTYIVLSYIARDLNNKLASLRSSAATLQLDKADPSWNEKIASWNVDGIEAPLVEDLPEELPHASESSISYPDALEFLITSTPWNTLLARIKASMILTPREGSLMNSIGKRVMTELTRMSRKADPVIRYNARFEIAWDPAEFLRLCYPNNKKQNLGSVIVIVGDLVDAQAGTCESYMRQTWPLTGVETLIAIERGLSLGQENSSIPQG